MLFFVFINVLYLENKAESRSTFGLCTLSSVRELSLKVSQIINGNILVR